MRARARWIQRVELGPGVSAGYDPAGYRVTTPGWMAIVGSPEIGSRQPAYSGSGPLRHRRSAARFEVGLSPVLYQTGLAKRGGGGGGGFETFHRSAGEKSVGTRRRPGPTSRYC